MLLAKIKDNQKFFRYILFSGHEYVKGEFRPVPKDLEYQARADERVDLKEIAKEEPTPAVPEVRKEVAPKSRKRSKDDLEELEA